MNQQLEVGEDQVKLYDRIFQEPTARMQKPFKYTSPDQHRVDLAASDDEADEVILLEQ